MLFDDFTRNIQFFREPLSHAKRAKGIAGLNPYGLQPRFGSHFENALLANI